MDRPAVAVAVLLGLVAGVACLGPVALAAEPTDEAPPESQPAETPREPTPAEQVANARLQKRLLELEGELRDLQKEEMKLTMNVLKAQAKALEGIKNMKEFQKALKEGKHDEQTDNYREIYEFCIAQVAAMETRYAHLVKPDRSLERDYERASPDVRARVDDFRARVWQKRRALLEKMAGLYESTFDNKKALQVYLAILQQLPEEQQKKETKLQEHIKKLQDSLKPKKKNENKSKEGTKDGTGKRASDLKKEREKKEQEELRKKQEELRKKMEAAGANK